MKTKLALAIIIALTGAVYADVFPITPLGPDASSAGFAGFVTSLILTILVELAVSSIYLSYRKLPKEILSSVVVANIISVPLVFIIAIVFPLWDMYLILLLIEFGVFMLEAAIISSMNKKKITSAEAITLSFFNNLASFIFGVLIMSILFVPPNPMQTQCSFTEHISCVALKVSAQNSKLSLMVGQGTGHNISITGVSCTENDSPDFAKEHVISYGNGNKIEMTSGNAVFVSNPDDATKPWMNISCTDANGNIPETITSMWYKGKIYINYTDEDTGIQRISVGSIKTLYESH